MTDSVSTTSRRHAIVIGGSMAGLVTARVLTNHFDRVTIVDRDRFPETAEPRNGVPQGRHIHILLIQGYRILEQLFPGLGADLAASGATLMNWGQDFKSFLQTGWLPRFESDLINWACTRPLLEWNIHRRVANLPKIRIIEGAEVTNLLSDEEKRCVIGVQLSFRRGAVTDLPDSLYGDFVVDASGRSSRTPEWLKTLGYIPPDETVINSFLAYATRWYERPAGHRADWKWLIIGAIPPHLPRNGGIAELEHGRWLVTVAGAARDYPPTDEAGFLDFAHRLAHPLIYETIKDATPLSPIYGYQRTQNRWVHYERLTRWPEHFVVIGDAVCGFNPIYGQGMSVAASGALMLDTCLHEQRRLYPNGDLTTIGLRFQKRLAKSNKIPWLLATSEDFRYPTTEGGTPGFLTRALHKYVNYFLRTLPKNPEAARVFTEVIHLVTPPSALLRPDLFLGVVKEALISRSPQL